MIKPVISAAKVRKPLLIGIGWFKSNYQCWLVSEISLSVKSNGQSKKSWEQGIMWMNSIEHVKKWDLRMRKQYLGFANMCFVVSLWCNFGKNNWIVQILWLCITQVLLAVRHPFVFRILFQLTVHLLKEHLYSSTFNQYKLYNTQSSKSHKIFESAFMIVKIIAFIIIIYLPCFDDVMTFQR